MSRFIYSLISAVALAAVAAPAAAAPVTFFGEDVNNAGDPNQVAPTNSTAARNSFFSNLMGVGTETFEGIAAGTSAPIAVSFGVAGTATINNGFVASGNNGAGRYAISGAQYLDAGSDNFSIGFSAPIAAFGFYGTDVGDFGGNLTLSLTDALGNVSSLVVPNTVGGGSGSIIYYGFYDLTNTYTSISFGNNSGGVDFFGFDDFSVGSTQQIMPGVPEPATWAMMITGFGLVGFASRNRRRKTVTA